MKQSCWSRSLSVDRWRGMYHERNSSECYSGTNGIKGNPLQPVVRLTGLCEATSSTQL